MNAMSQAAATLDFKPNPPSDIVPPAQAAMESEATIAALRARVPPGVRVLMIDNYD